MKRFLPLLIEYCCLVLIERNLKGKYLAMDIDWEKSIN